MENITKKLIPIKFSNYEVLNSAVSRAKVYIQYAGKNRNKSIMSRDSIEGAIPSMYGIPVVGEFREEEENFKGHGGKIVIDSDGVKFIDTTVPYGFIPLDEELADVRWEEVTDDDGNSKNYLVANAYLWRRRYPELDITFEKDSNQSMEILIDEAEWTDDGYFDIKKFTYDALCILGRDTENPDNNTEPAFEDAKIEAFSFDKDVFKSEFTLMMKEIKDSMKENFALPLEDIGTGEKIDIDNSKDSAVGESEGTWGNVDKAKERDKVMLSSNYVTVADEMYLLIDKDNLAEAPSTSVKYPHHVVEDGKLVIHIDGLEAAGSRLNQVKSEDEISGADYDKALAHVNEHRNELGIDELEAFKLKDQVENKEIVVEEEFETKPTDKVDEVEKTIETEVKSEEFKVVEGNEEIKVEEVIENHEEKSFALTAMQTMEALDNALDGEIIRDEEGNFIQETYYWAQDYDETYVYFVRNVWNIDGDRERNDMRATFSIEDEKAVIDLAGAEVVFFVRMTKEEKDALEMERDTNLNTLQNDFDLLKESNEELQTNYDNAMAKINDSDQEKRTSEENALFSGYDSLLKDVVEYDDLKSKSSEYSMEDLKKEIALLYVENKNILKTNKKDDKSNFVEISFSNKDDKNVESPYGDIFEETK